MEDECPVCEVPFGGSLFDYINSTVKQQNHKDEEQSYTFPKDIADLMLCCDETRDECTCHADNKVSFLDADKALQEYENLEPYRDNGTCQDCVFIESSACRPYVRYLKKFTEYHKHEYGLLNSITVCTEFLDYEAAQREGII